MKLLCSCFSKKKKINIVPIDLSSTSSKIRPTSQINPEMYYDIKSTIQHFDILSDTDIEFIYTLPSIHLAQFIKIYNLHVKNMRSIIDIK